MTRLKTNLIQALLLLSSMLAVSQVMGQKRVTGTVTDNQNTPLIGVNIFGGGDCEWNNY